MPKHKTHKGLAKRVKVTGGGKIKRKKAFAGHLKSSKTGKRIRSLRQSTGMSVRMTQKTKACLGA
jgi:large subunit ribosomal protein L35